MVLLLCALLAVGTLAASGTAAADEPIEPYELSIDADGDAAAVGFPGPVDGGLESVFAEGTDGVAVVYALEDGSWEQQTNFDQSIEPLDAIVVVTDDDAEVDSVPLEVAFERGEATDTPSQQALDTGWNFVSASAYEDADAVFGVSDTQLVLDRFHRADSSDLQTVDSFTNYFAGSADPPAVDAFNGYFVFVEGDTAIPSVLSGAEDRAEADDQLGVIRPASFDVSELSAPSAATQGEEITVTATIQNIGDRDGTTDVDFRLAESEEGLGDDATVATEALSLESGASDTVSFDVEIPALEPGTYVHEVVTETDSETAAIDIELPDADAGALTFDDQPLAADGSVIVDDVETNGAAALAVTYTDGEEEVLAGLADADALESEPVNVTVEDDGGFPGQHTAWLFADGDVPDEAAIGDDVSELAGAELDADSADVSAADAETGALTFDDQPLDENGTVSVTAVESDGAATLAVTYTDGDDEVLAGLADATDLEGDDINVSVQDDGGFPGEHTAWLFADSDVPADTEIGDDVSALAGAELAVDSAEVTLADAATGALTFSDQSLAEDGTVFVSDVESDGAATLAVTYSDGDEEVLAGIADADALEREDSAVAVEDAGGFPGEHTAWLFAAGDVPADAGIGDDVSALAGTELAVDSADISEAEITGSLTFDDQPLAADGTVTVSDVETTGDATLAVTYTDGDEEILAGVSAADSVDGDDLAVAVEDTGGFPGEHTAWLFADGDVPDDATIGDDVSALAGAELAVDSADISLADAETGALRFDEQPLEDGSVTVEDVESDGAATLAVTYTDGDEEVLAGVADADALEQEAVSVAVEDVGGFPGVHTAWLFADGDVPDDPAVGDDVSALAGAELAIDAGEISEADAPAGELTFDDQPLAADGTVTVSDVESNTDATLAVTYTDGDDEVLAGIANADDLAGDDVAVTVEDAGGFPGEHTAWLFADEDVPEEAEIGDDVSALAGAELAVDSADVREDDTDADTGSLTLEEQGGIGFVTLEAYVDAVETNGDATLAVTYTDGDSEVLSGIESANNKDGETVDVELEDLGGVDGEHTAWLFPDSDVPDDVSIGDDVSALAGSELDRDTAAFTAL